jgi:histidinol-phosphate aminotransferase
MAQKAASAALDDQEFVEKSRETYKAGAELISNFCKGAGLEFEPTAANFILIKTGKGMEYFKLLQENGVIVRPMDGYKLPDWIRVSLGTEEENGKFIRVMGDNI